VGNVEENPIKIRIRGAPGGNSVSTGFLVGVLLITGGTVLFIDNLQILPVDLAGAFGWFVLLIYSAGAFWRTRSNIVRLWAGMGMLAGVLLILGNYHVIRATSDIIWPLILITAGVSMLIYRFQWLDFKRRMNFGGSSRGSNSTGTLDEFAIFSGVKRRVEATSFEGGELNSIFGSIEMDLRRASIINAGRLVEIEANTAFGSIEIRIPENWKLNMQGQAIFGAYEDKTIPARPEPGVQMPVLVIRGNSIFGAVVVRN
jgi:predicted membrane protein